MKTCNKLFSKLNQCCVQKLRRLTSAACKDYVAQSVLHATCTVAVETRAGESSAVLNMRLHKEIRAECRLCDDVASADPHQTVLSSGALGKHSDRRWHDECIKIW